MRSDRRRPSQRAQAAAFLFIVLIGAFGFWQMEESQRKSDQAIIDAKDLADEVQYLAAVRTFELCMRANRDVDRMTGFALELSSQSSDPDRLNALVEKWYRKEPCPPDPATAVPTPDGDDGSVAPPTTTTTAAPARRQTTTTTRLRTATSPTPAPTTPDEKSCERRPDGHRRC